MNNLKLNLCCGEKRISNYINVDKELKILEKTHQDKNLEIDIDLINNLE